MKYMNLLTPCLFSRQHFSRVQNRKPKKKGNKEVFKCAQSDVLKLCFLQSFVCLVGVLHFLNSMVSEIITHFVSALKCAFPVNSPPD